MTFVARCGKISANLGLFSIEDNLPAALALANFFRAKKNAPCGAFRGGGVTACKPQPSPWWEPSPNPSPCKWRLPWRRSRRARWQRLRLWRFRPRSLPRTVRRARCSQDACCRQACGYACGYAPQSCDWACRAFPRRGCQRWRYAEPELPWYPCSPWCTFFLPLRAFVGFAPFAIPFWQLS